MNSFSHFLNKLIMNTVIITGDTGVGKSFFANMLLQKSCNRTKLYDGIHSCDLGYTSEELNAMRFCKCLIIDHIELPAHKNWHLLNELISCRLNQGLKNIIIVQSKTSLMSLRHLELPVISSILVDHKTVSIDLIKNTDLDEMVDVLCDILYKKKSSKLESGIDLGFDAIIGLLLLVALWLYLFNPSEHYWLVGISIGVLTGEWLNRLFRIFFPKYMRRVH